MSTPHSTRRQLQVCKDSERWLRHRYRRSAQCGNNWRSYRSRRTREHGKPRGRHHGARLRRTDRSARLYRPPRARPKQRKCPAPGVRWRHNSRASRLKCARTYNPRTHMHDCVPLSHSWSSRWAHGRLRHSSRNGKHWGPSSISARQLVTSPRVRPRSPARPSRCPSLTTRAA